MKPNGYYVKAPCVPRDYSLIEVIWETFEFEGEFYCTVNAKTFYHGKPLIDRKYQRTFKTLAASKAWLGRTIREKKRVLTRRLRAVVKRCSPPCFQLRGKAKKAAIELTQAASRYAALIQRNP